MKNSASDTAKTAILGHLLLHDLQSTISPTIDKKELSTIRSKIDKFIQQDYYKSLITQNEAYELHKDNNPINHKVVTIQSIIRLSIMGQLKLEENWLIMMYTKYASV